MDLDEKDRKIIREVMKNPKITDSELADKIDLSRSGAAKRRKKLEDNDEIQYYASPNLKKPSKVISGLFKLPPSKELEEAKHIAKKFSKRKEIISSWLRKTGGRKWTISFLAFSEEFEDKVKIDKEIEKWIKEIRKASEGHIEVDIDEVSTHFMKILNRELGKT